MIDFSVASVLVQAAWGIYAVGLLAALRPGVRPGLRPSYGWWVRVMSVLVAASAFIVAVVAGGDPDRTVMVGAGSLVLLAVASSVVSMRHHGFSPGDALGWVRRRLSTLRLPGAAVRVVDDRHGEASAGVEADRDSAVVRGLDTVVVLVGLVVMVVLSRRADSQPWLVFARSVTGAVLVGSVVDTMVMARLHLADAHLERSSLASMVDVTIGAGLIDLIVMFVPTGMISVLDGDIDADLGNHVTQIGGDGFSSLLGWFWVACLVTGAGLLVMARVAARTREHSAVMTVTGLWYLVMLTMLGAYLTGRLLLVP